MEGAMTEPMDITPSKSPRKRSLPEDDAVSVEKSESLPTPPLTASPAHQDHANRQGSPAPSTSTLTSVHSANNDRPAGSTDAPPRKRRKLTAAEKEEQRVAKEQKDRERAEAKLKKDEEKRRKNEEKEAKQREKDLKKTKEEEEKQKKARAQPKIASFFKQPSSASSPIKSQPVIIEPEWKPSQPVGVEAPTTSPEVRKSPKQSDYRKTFLSFEPKPYTKCAPYVLPRTGEEAQHAKSEMDGLLECLAKKESPSSSTPATSSFFAKERARSRGLWQPTAREVVESLQGSSAVPIDLTDELGAHYRPTDLLGTLTIRHIHFGEDVRPPYFGSYTRPISPRKLEKIRRRPLSKLREDTNYDYDSEAEWEEPEEGEDILSDGEDDEESVGSADEMEGFLDDEDNSAGKRRLITGDLKPISTGICWEDAKGQINTSAQDSSQDLRGMRIEFLVDAPKASINPFSSSYWHSGAAVAPSSSTPKTSGSFFQPENGKMKPPRNPLQPRPTPNESMTIIGASSGMKGPIMSIASAKTAKAAAKPLQGQELFEFKDAVEGSNLTKNDLQKALKKRFPKHTNETIKATLSSCFARVGQHEAEKVWKHVGS